MDRYKKNLKVEGDKVYSYDTHVATIDQEAEQLIVHGWWSATTSRHINYVAQEYGLKQRYSSTLLVDTLTLLEELDND